MPIVRYVLRCGLRLELLHIVDRVMLSHVCEVLPLEHAQAAFTVVKVPGMMPTSLGAFLFRLPTLQTFQRFAK